MVVQSANVVGANTKKSSTQQVNQPQTIYVQQAPTTTTTTTSYTGYVDPTTQTNYNKYNQAYVQSNSVTDAYNALQNVLNNKPGEFNSQFSGQLNNLYDQIINRREFSYDQNEDVMYGLYKDQYTQAGKSAMNNAIGQGAAATGGFANSAAQSAGFNAYMGYLNELNNQALNLQQKAFNRYRDEGDMLNAKFNTTNNMYNQEYNQYRDSVSDWQNDRSYAQNVYESERDYDLSQFENNRNYWNSEYWNKKKSATTTVSTTS